MNLETCIYPTLKLSKREISAFMTPTDSELDFCRQNCKRHEQKACFLILLKTTQFLNFVPTAEEIPYSIIRHINELVNPKTLPKTAFVRYMRSGARARHLKPIRAYLQLKPFDQTTLEAAEQYALSAAETKVNLYDIINATIEHLIRNNYELPSLGALERIARDARKAVNQSLFHTIANSLTPEQKRQLDTMISDSERDGHFSEWNRLKTYPKKVKPKRVKEHLIYLQWLNDLCEGLSLPKSLPVDKLTQFKNEARSLDAAHILRLKPHKRYSLALILILSQRAEALDNVAEMFSKLVRDIYRLAKTDEQETYLSKKQRSDNLIKNFQSVLTKLNESQNDAQILAAVKNHVTPNLDRWLAQCNRHLSRAENHHIPFMLQPYSTRRSVLFDCLDAMTLKSLHGEEELIGCWEYLKENRHNKDTNIDLYPDGRQRRCINLNWVPKAWQNALKRKGDNFSEARQLNRKLFEICVFIHLNEEIRAGNIAIVHADKNGDHSHQYICDQTLKLEKPGYAKLVGLPPTGKAFTKKLRDELAVLCRNLDQDLPTLDHAHIENGKLKLARVHGSKRTEAQEKIDRKISQHLEKVSIVDIITQTVGWLDLNKYFRPVSDYKGRMTNSKERLIATIFCYGCNIGPTQTAASLKGLDRRQIAWLNLRYANERTLSKAITQVIKAYEKLEIARHWGDGRSMSADGTHRQTLEDNLLSTFHIRYRKLGRICYFQTSNSYICLFSHFIPCGIHESNFLFDGIARSELENTPEKIHGDSHAQTLAAFGLGHLLGIELMPRIKNVKNVTLFRPKEKMNLKNTGKLFGDTINWQVIEDNLDEMYRIALSVKHGLITPSIILRRMSTKSRKNNVFYAFQELGKAIRTRFLLQYISDYSLRKLIHRETNKSEQFNNFAKWVSFFDDGKISDQHLHEQEKIIKYQHLLANLVILYNAEAMTRAITKVREEGVEISAEYMRHLAPYWTHHINRLGEYRVNADKELAPMITKMPALSDWQIAA